MTGGDDEAHRVDRRGARAGLAAWRDEAAAHGFILILVAAASLIVINKVAGTRMGGMFG